MNVAVAALLLRAPLLRLGLLLGGSPTLGCALAWLPVAAYVGLTGAAAPAVEAAAPGRKRRREGASRGPCWSMTVLLSSGAGGAGRSVDFQVEQTG